MVALGAGLVSRFGARGAGAGGGCDREEDQQGERLHALVFGVFSLEV